MYTSHYLPHLEFDDEFADDDVFEMEERGLLSGARIVTPEGKKYQVTFFDPDRVKHAVASYAEVGIPCLVDKGIIIIPRVTIENINIAVKYVLQTSYLNSLKPCCDEDNTAEC